MSAAAGRLRGSADQDAALEPGLIGRDQNLHIALEDQRPIPTSRVLRLRVARGRV